MPNINRIHLPDGNTYDLVKKELTQAEYNALTEEEKNNGTVYLISDVSSSRIAIETLINIIYPVGSIYISVTDDTVAKVEARFGGTWESFAQGRTLVGVSTETEFNTVQKTGGEKTHTLNVNEIPSHTHRLEKRQQWYSNDTVVSTSAGSIYSWKAGEGTGGSTSKSYQCTYDDVLAKGGSQSHNNLQPYITVYMYKRTA